MTITKACTQAEPGDTIPDASTTLNSVYMKKMQPAPTTLERNASNNVLPLQSGILRNLYF